MSDSPTHAAVQAQFDLDGGEDRVIRVPDEDEIRFESAHEKRIFDLLQKHRGADTAITAAEIAEQVNLKDGDGCSKTRKMLTNLHSQGVPLVSQTTGNPGFYLAKTPEEGLEYIESLNNRIEGTKQRRDQSIRNILLNMVPESEAVAEAEEEAERKLAEDE